MPKYQPKDSKFEVTRQFIEKMSSFIVPDQGKLLEENKKKFGSKQANDIFDENNFFRQIKPMYRLISNFNQLLYTNILFFNDLIPLTFYHLGPIFDSNIKNLIIINEKLKFFTMDGQSNHCDDEEKQRSYLYGIIDKSKFEQILPFIDDRLYFIAHTLNGKNERLYSNIDQLNQDELIVTYDEDDPTTSLGFILDSTSAVGSVFELMEDDSFQPTLIEQIRQNCISLHLIAHEFCKDRIDDILIDIIENAEL